MTTEVSLSEIYVVDEIELVGGRRFGDARCLKTSRNETTVAPGRFAISSKLENASPTAGSNS